MIKATDSVTRRNIPGVHGMFGMQVETAQTRLFESLLSRKLRFEKKMRKAVVGRAAVRHSFKLVTQYNSNLIHVI